MVEEQEDKKDMTRAILKCTSCNQYTLKELCSTCNKLTLSPKPGRYSPQFRHKNLRQEARKEELSKKGMY